MDLGMIWLTAAFMMLSSAPMPIPQRTIPMIMHAGLPVRKMKQEKKVLHRVARTMVFSPILSKSQPKNRAAKASTAMASAYSRLNDAAGNAAVLAAWRVIMVKSEKPKA